MSNANYRSFIILRQDCKGYAISSKEPFGYCKIDAYGNKARFQLYVQELKIIPKEKGYRFTLLANLPTGPKQIPIDNFFVDDKGKRNIKFEMDRNNIGDSGLKVEQIEGVAILVEDSLTNTVAPLLGFKKEPFKWNNKKTRAKSLEKEEKIQVINKEENHKKEKVKEVEVEDRDIKEFEEINKEIDRIEDTVKEGNQKVEINDVNEEKKEEVRVEEKEDIEAIKVFESEKFKEEDFPNIFEYEKEKEEKLDLDREDSLTNDIGQLIFNSSDYWNFYERKSKEEDYINKIIEKSIRMNPFEKPNEEMEWYRISYEELPLIINFPWRWYSNPFLLVGAKKYNHLILGKNKKLNTYCLGIPDLYSSYSKERAESFGYRTFLCCRNTQASSGEYGYWIIDLVINS